MTKSEVAALLGISERSVNNWADKGELTITYIKGKTRDVADFDEAQVNALKAKLEAQNAKPAKRESGNVEYRNIESRNSKSGNVEIKNLENGRSIVPISQTVNPEAVNVQGFNFQVLTQEQFAELLDMQSRAGEVRITEKPILTFTEASEYSGIPEKRLRDAAKNDELKVARNLGRAAKIQRSELDKWIAAQFK